jgi:hypothetical protein
MGNYEVLVTAYCTVVVQGAVDEDEALELAYDVVLQDGAVSYAGTRQEVREKKQLFAEFGNKAKIVRRVYKLECIQEATK